MSQKFINNILKLKTGEVHSMGLSEFNKILLKAESLKTVPKEKVSQLWLIIGDIYFINNAIISSLNAYKKGLEINNENLDAYYEVADKLFNIGNYNEALVFAKKLLEFDDEYIDLVDNIEFYKKNKLEPDYDINDDSIVYAEMLAKGNYKDLLNVLKGKRSKLHLRYKLAALGALKKNKEYLKNMELLFDKYKKIEFDFFDWFYMPIEIFSSQEIWKILLSNINKIKKGVFASIDNLSTYKLSTEKYRELICRYSIAEISNDKKTLNTLYKKYPKLKG